MLTLSGSRFRAYFFCFAFFDLLTAGASDHPEVEGSAGQMAVCDTFPTLRIAGGALALTSFPTSAFPILTRCFIA